MKKTPSILELIDALGGSGEVSRVLKTNIMTVLQWVYRQSIPPHYLYPLWLYAKKHHLMIKIMGRWKPITPVLLLEIVYKAKQVRDTIK